MKTCSNYFGLIFFVRCIHCMLFTLIFGNPLFSQKKFERESRIDASEIPLQAIEFVRIFALDAKVKWYLEESIEISSIEAKFKSKKIKYSIEFDLEGKLQDIEVETKWNELDNAVKSSIHTILRDGCDKYKIQKTQIQYIGSNGDLINYIMKGLSPSNITKNIELVVKCCSKHDVKLFEYLFNETGILISSSEIILQNSSNLEY